MDITYSTKDEQKLISQRIASKKSYYRNKDKIADRRKYARMVERTRLREAAGNQHDPTYDPNCIQVTGREECVILLTNKIKNIKSLPTYISHLNRFYNLKICDEFDDIIRCLRNYESMCSIIAEGKYGLDKIYGLKSILGIFQLLLFMLDNFFEWCYSESEFLKIRTHIENSSKLVRLATGEVMTTL